MSVLHVKLEHGIVRENYKRGMQKMMALPINYDMDYPQEKRREFFAYLTTLGGGLVNGDSYVQTFTVKDTKAAISSQSSQKIYKGTSELKTILEADEKSTLMFHNDANIFYANSNFKSKTIVYLKENSRFFYVDGGFLGYADGEFSANMTFRMYVDYKLALNDVFYYDYDKSYLNGLYGHEYYYTVIIRGAPEFQTIHKDNIKSHTSTIDGTTIIRIASDNNDVAMDYINEIKVRFLKESEMTLVSAKRR